MSGVLQRCRFGVRTMQKSPLKSVDFFTSRHCRTAPFYSLTLKPNPKHPKQMTLMLKNPTHQLLIECGKTAFLLRFNMAQTLNRHGCINSPINQLPVQEVNLPTISHPLMLLHHGSPRGSAAESPLLFQKWAFLSVL